MTRSCLLIVDDTPENIELLVSLLGRHTHDYMTATGGERALELAARRLPDLVLLDVSMPGIDGFETCRRLRQMPLLAEVPVLFVTARTDEVSEGFAAGGADYITKPLHADELRARVQHQLERRRLMQQLHQLNQHLEQRVRERTQELVQANRQLREEINERRFIQDRLSYLATHDFVTRLHNRDALENRLQQRLAAGFVDCLLAVELSRFRIVNDSCGYVAGDELLREVSELLVHTAEPGDFIARLGGDRFALLTEQDPAAALQLARRIQQAFDGFAFRWNEREYPVRARVAVLPLGSPYTSFEQVLAKADEASYLARAEGDSVVRLHSSLPGDADPRDAVNWAHRLMDALRLQQLRVYFQRIEPLQQGLPEGVHIEVLVRLWDAEQGRVIAPGVFMQPAERYQLIDQIDRWVLARVLAELAPCAAQLGQVSVNLSAQSLRNPRLADEVLAQLDACGFPADKLCFEITEGEAIGSVELAQRFMGRLRERGVKFSLDDFGTGFASFAYLKTLSFDRLKIDGAFVRDMDSVPAHAAMVASMVQMAQALKLPVVAEFVERPAVLARLRELGVQYAQGFLLHQPEPLTAAALQTSASTTPG